MRSWKEQRSWCGPPLLPKVQTADDKAIVGQLQCRFPASVTDSEPSKVMQYLQVRSLVETASYPVTHNALSAYLQAGGD